MLTVKQELYRGLGGVMNFAFGFTEVGVLVGICGLYNYGLTTGGPSAIIWGWIVAYAVTMIVALNMAEICSAFPSAGSVYHWTGQLVPAKLAPVMSYACGWANFLGNAAGDASFAYSWASFFDAARVASGQPETLGTYELVGITILILFIWSLLNICRIDAVGWINNIGAVVQIGTIICIIIGCLSVSEVLMSGSFVFTTYYNETGIASKSYVGAISLLCALWSFSGYEASAHMAEETNDAARNAPKGILWTCVATGIGGLGLLFTLLFCTQDIDAVLYDDDDSYYLAGTNGQNATLVSSALDTSYFTGVASFNVFMTAAGPKFGAALCWLVVIVTFFAGLSSVAVTGRITFALARDDGFPFSKTVAQVHPYFKSPLMAIIMVWFFDSLLLLLPLVNSVAFNSITGIATIGFQVSYAIPIFMKVLYPEEPFPESKFDLGIFSRPLGLFSTIWLLGTSCLFFLPEVHPVTKDTMNWTIVVVAGFTMIGTVNWFVNARYTFRGPKRAEELVKVKAISLVNVGPASAEPEGNQSGGIEKM